MSEPAQQKPAAEPQPPRIIPRDRHPISRKDIDLEALKVMYRLRDAGFAAYLVGGGVRDLYLGKTPKDFDISTDARPGQIRKIFRNSRVIGKRFRLVQVFFPGNKIVEVSTLRCLSEYDLDGPEEVLPPNNTFGTVAEDSRRRDLTINSLFYNIADFSVIDHVGGVDDLEHGVIRIIGDPGRRIRRDPVRIMRAVRHAARIGFTIEPETWRAIEEHLDYLEQCPDSRIRDELFKDLKSGACAGWARLALECGLFSVLFPFYTPDLLAEAQAELLANLEVADRFQVQGAGLPEHILLALLLLPWARRELNLEAAPEKGAAGANFARETRASLDLLLQKLNITRAQKEGIATLLVNLPVFLRQGGKGAWPQWLTRKSYFPEGQLLFEICREAAGGEPAKIPKKSLPPPVAEPRKGGKRRGGRRRSSRAPAMVSRSNGGIFGLRKHDH